MLVIVLARITYKEKAIDKKNVKPVLGNKSITYLKVTFALTMREQGVVNDTNNNKK